MSMEALLRGGAAFLQSADGLSLGTDQCDEQPDGQPPPTAKYPYYAVHEGDWSNDQTEYLNETYGFEVTITIRAGVAPVDRYAVVLKRELWQLAAQLRAKIHGNDLLRIKANTFIDGQGVTVNGFVEPLRFRSAGKVQPRDQAWFWADDYKGNSPPSGLSITLVFGGAVRAQMIEGQT
jgi:hypothetical protein